MSSFPAFSDVFAAIHGYTPFPWQARLADEVLSDRWPDLLDLPTGAGKTAALDVALYCLARAPDRMPRRTVLVVDRRIVVDQGALHARKIQRALASATSGPLAVYASALRELSGDSTIAPVDVAVMRGGMPRDNDWAKRPDRPLLGVSTVDQIGSRLLFRGYGIGKLSTSIHAGLIGHDTLILLDEVHLAIPLAETLDQIRSRYRHQMGGLPDRFAVVQMSATAGPRDESKRVFGLGSGDREHPVLRRRLESSKTAKLELLKVTGDDEAVKQRAMAGKLVSEVKALQRDGNQVVAIVVNRVETARLAFELLREAATRAILVTGRMRPVERDLLATEALMPAAGVGRTRANSEPLVVVATQCIEAGADLDFDALVTECASLDALKQRFGRLDRIGERGGNRAVIVGRSDIVGGREADPIYGEAIARTWSWLEENAADGAIDFGIGRLPASDDPALLATTGHAPVLLPSHLDSLAHTSPPRPSPDHDIGLWLHGPDRSSADVQIVWRTGVALPSGPDDARADELRDRLVGQLESVRPSSLEGLTLPVYAARRWLEQVATADGAARSRPVREAVAVTDAIGVDLEVFERRRTEKELGFVALRWNGDRSEFVQPHQIRPGDVLVVDLNTGGLERQARSDGAGVWSFFSSGSTSSVHDLGDVANLRGRGRASLRLPRRVVRDAWSSENDGARYEYPTLAVWALPDSLLAESPEPDDNESAPEFRARTLAWLESLPENTGSESPLAATNDWARLRSSLVSGHLRISHVDDWIYLEAADVGAVSVDVDDAVTESDDSSFRASEVTLTQHSADVRAKASAYAGRLGLPTSVANDVALAAWLHDVGKADPRFQRWLVGGSEVRALALPELLAKSSLPSGNQHAREKSRQRAGYPRGYRHELLSLAMVESSAALDHATDRDLVLHLVASHHGWCRPFAPPIDDVDEVSVRYEHGGVSLSSSSRHGLARLDSGVAERYWRLVRKYGWWGLAWLEAIVRLADHRASEDAVSANHSKGVA